MTLQKEPVSHQKPKPLIAIDPEQGLAGFFVPAPSFESQVNEHVLATLRNYSFGALGLLFLTSLGVGWVIAGRVLAPIDRITGVAQRIQATDLSQRINLEGPDDELKRLAQTFDGMLARLDEAFEAQRRFIADASHELRNPLAIIRTNLDVDLLDPTAGPERMQHAADVVRRATERMGRLVDDLLALARLDAPRSLEEKVDLAAIADEVAEEYAAVAAERGLSLYRALHAADEVRGDPQSLKRAIANLVDNAIRFGPPGTAVSVSSGTQDGWAYAAVQDRGPGIRPEDQERVFERFWRADKARSRAEGGSGLGLAIVRQIVDSHGGAVRLSSTPNEGSTFVVWLPRVGAATASSEAPLAVPLMRAS
jgi:signal transduction histidine kinase